MKNLGFLFSLALLTVVFVTACHSGSGSNETNAASSTNEPSSAGVENSIETPDQNEIVVDQTTSSVPTTYGFEGQGWYKRLEGTIGGLPVTVHLIQHTELAGVFDTIPRTSIYGFYFYDKYQQPIRLYQYHPDPDQTELKGKIVLYEHSIDLMENQWQLSFNDDGPGYYEGSWRRPDKENSLDIHLESVFPKGAEPLQLYWLADRQNNPYGDGIQNEALISLSMLYPDVAEDMNADLVYNIIWRIIPAFADADLAERAGGPEEVLRMMHDQFFQAHEEEKAALKDEPELLEPSVWQQKMTVVWNDDLHLALGIERYKAMNGANTEIQTRYLNIDLNKWEEITLDNVFKAGYENALNHLLQQSAQKTFAQMPGGDELDASKAKITDNYVITNKGIWFNYEPYHFNSFDPREHQLFATFDRLATFVKPYWLGIAH